MSVAHTLEQPSATVVDPVATQPIIAAESTPETVKPIPAESSASSEGTAGVDAAPATAPASGTTSTGAGAGVGAGAGAEAEKSVSKDEAVIESQPINEGVLQYKAPGLVK